ncbi:PLP-dependent aminotransferase family protein [Clostridium sp. YIM B02515]|uniref:PLP-dependent aminotransferase family protein n=1 Tax=Clostridium rhizosphaerae TaxID=2803861 RepID=A0ABS1T6S4_9CLOT|nr:PLP-dependent aminotransferase family protein [Clostridium rhizosphaerae]MBL4935005.1 PLP-dependent aminotransferase family protein [Clostridium rhizosphaerae]
MFELASIFKKNLDSPLYCQLYQHIREEIKSDKLPVGTKLPSIRQLSQDLNISKNTVELAYQQLTDEGYIKSRPRSGLYVAELEKDFNRRVPVLADSRQKEKDNLKQEYKYDFDPNAVDLEHFPFSTWKKITNECLNPYRNDLFKYDVTMGNNKLREVISMYLRHSRGVYCDSSQIIIGATNQHLIGILFQILSFDKFKVAIEDPGCIEMKSIFKNFCFEFVGIPVDNDGIDLEKLKCSGAKLVYITPSKQFPCSVVMPIGKRLSLLKWAEEEDVLIIEGDYDGEYRYHGKPIPALQGLTNANNVIYLSTFSKYIFPSICISYMVLPEKLAKIYNNGLYFHEQSVPRISQQILHQFIEGGNFERHLRKMRNLYSKKHMILINSINEFLGDKVTIVGKDAGLHILIQVDNGMTEEELIELAALRGVKVYSYKAYLWNRDTYSIPRIIIGFGGLNIDSIVYGIKLLKEAWN